ncbi:MAG: DUF808 domain-containing protein [Gemmatimonadetes bacterium]|nr:DUF808 domain-containing protein [Gemmatimonadota bacterium]
MPSSLFALLDDITSLLDDIAVLSKVAVRKTAGVVGDDLALNAEQVTGFAAERELPVVWAVAKGSLLNKLILVPSALLISAFAPALVLPLLMIGGIYLCFEGFEKVAHKLLHRADSDAHERTLAAALVNVQVDLVAIEQERIKGAIRTDFILSAEIVVIALGTISTQPIAQQIGALSVIGVAITVLVYGLVAAIVKLDDLGLALHRGRGVGKAFGAMLLRLAPWLMRSLTVVGTTVMFMVGGSIIAHGVAPIEHFIESMVSGVGGGVVGTLAQTLLHALTGVIAGGVVVALVTGVKKLGKR